jgi:uncharacterized protein YacL
MLHAIRLIFIFLCGIIGAWIGSAYHAGAKGLGIGMALSAAVVLLEFAFARRFIGIVSVLMFGVLIGFVGAHFLIAAFYLIPSIEREVRDVPALRLHIEFAVTFVCTFISVIAILHTKDELKFVIPFVELKREGAQSKPLLLDTSAIIDGRIVDVIETRVVDTPIVVPRFVLNELQQVADSQDKLKRNRGRRGLDVLQRLRQNKRIEVQVQDVEIPHLDTVDAKLVRLAKMINGRIVTTDFNLNKVAQVQDVEVVNVNDIANALRPVVLQGERLQIKVIRTGESPGQGVGYLDDGTMVVAEECAGRIGQQVELVVTNVLQTSAGRLIFGRPA